MMVKNTTNAIINTNKSPNIGKTNKTGSLPVSREINAPAYNVDIKMQKRLENLLKDPDFVKNIEKSVKDIDMSTVGIERKSDTLNEDACRETMINGDDNAALSFRNGREIPSKLKPEAKEALERYYNAADNIVKGGKKVFKEYNLEYAAIAAFSTNELADERAQATISAGNYSKEDYQKIKDMAKELQDKAGVYVAIDTSLSTLPLVTTEGNWQKKLYENTDFSYNSIEFSYNNTLLTLGGNRLNFMADNKDAESIWINLARGNYKNDNEVIDALQENGYQQIADDYKNKIYISGAEYDKKDGELWKATVGYTPGTGDTSKYNDLRKELFGSDEISFDYTKAELDKAYKNAPAEYEKLKKYPMDREYIKSDDDSSNSADKRVQALRKRIAAINKQIHEIKATDLNQESKAETINNLEKNIQNLQQQINDILEDELKKLQNKLH